MPLRGGGGPQSFLGLNMVFSLLGSLEDFGFAACQFLFYIRQSFDIQELPRGVESLELPENREQFSFVFLWCFFCHCVRGHLLNGLRRLNPCI